MSTRIMTMVWSADGDKLSGSKRLIMLALADNANDEGLCWPSLSTIAQKVALSRRQVIRLIGELESDGFITVAREQDKRNRYTIDLDMLVTPMSPPSHSASDTHVTRVVTPMSPGTKPSYNRKDIKKESTKEKKQQGTEIPEPLRTAVFFETWEEFKEHRKQIKKPMTPLAEKKMLKKLSEFCADDAVLALNTSIENGWIGVFPKHEKWQRQPNVAADGGVSAR